MQIRIVGSYRHRGLLQIDTKNLIHTNIFHAINFCDMFIYYNKEDFMKYKHTYTFRDVPFGH